MYEIQDLLHDISETARRYALTRHRLRADRSLPDRRRAIRDAEAIVIQRASVVIALRRSSLRDQERAA